MDAANEAATKPAAVENILVGAAGTRSVSAISAASEEALAATAASPETSAATVDMLSSALSESCATEDVDVEVLTETDPPNKCRPHDLGDFKRRLVSFCTPWWFNRPVGLSPLAAARRGWSCKGPNLLECNVCYGELCLKYDQNGIWLANGEPVALSAASANGAVIYTSACCRAALEKGHSLFCPWRSSEVTLHDPSRLSDDELAAGVQSRRRSLLETLKCLPIVVDGDQEARDAALVLATAGWEAVPQKDCDMLQCSICLRTLVVQAFAHQSVVDATAGDRGRSEEGEPPDKMRRKQPSPPDPRWWRPQLRGISTSAALGQQAVIEKCLLDPYALHRYYCPMYSRPDEELGVAATRVVKARESVACKAGPGEVQDLAAAGLAAAKAEDLLRALDTLLPQERLA